MAPVCFVENVGQIVDQKGNERKDIDYKLFANGVTIFIGKGQLHYQFVRENKNENARANDILPHFGACLNEDNNAETYRVDVTLMNINFKAVSLTDRPQPYCENYYLPQCYGKKAHSFRKITYRNIYKGIDWVLYIKGNKLEYDFVVHKNGNAKDIQIEYKGNNGQVKF
jgi:hypothetical protein